MRLQPHEQTSGRSPGTTASGASPRTQAADVDAPDGHTRTITRHYDSVPVVRLILAGFLVTIALVLTMKLLSGLVDSASEAGGVELVPATAGAASSSPPGVNTQSSTLAAQPAASQHAAQPAAQPVQDPAVAAAGTDMRVNLRAQERVRATVNLDGTTVFSGWLSPGERHDFLAKDRIAVDVSDLTLIAIHYNGERVDPLGNLIHPRRLVFLRDAE